MNGEVGNAEVSEEIEDELESSNDDVALMADDDDDDNVGDMSVEINVEELVARIEKGDDAELNRKRDVRRRLDELREQREAAAELDSTFNFNLDDDL